MSKPAHSTLLTLVILGCASACAEPSAHEQPAELAVRAPAVAPAPAPVVDNEPPPLPVPETRVVSVELASSASLERDGLVYGRFLLTAHEAVEEVTLQVHGGTGVEVEEVVGLQWRGRADGAAIELAGLEEGETRFVVVGFSTDGSNQDVQAQVTFQEPGARATTVTEPAVELRLLSGMRDAQVLVDVQRARTKAVLEETDSLAADGLYQEALELVQHTRGTNVEVGLAMRVSRDLEPSQQRLAEREAEIEEARKPKPKPRTKPRKEIEIITGVRG